MNMNICEISKPSSQLFECIIPSEIVEKVYAFLEADDRVWVHFMWKNGLVWSSIPSHLRSIRYVDDEDTKKIWWANNSYYDSHLQTTNEAIGVVIARETNGKTARDILREWIEKKVTHNQIIL